MTEADAFMTAIIESPWDDSPRLMFADWLEEHGQEERANFIRVQVELAAILQERNGLAMEAVEPLRRCEWALFSKDDSKTLAWFGLPQPLARIVRLEPFDRPHADYPYAIARRGFLECVVCSAAAWLTQCIAYDSDGGLLATQPVVEVEFSDARDSVFRRTKQETVQAFRERIMAAVFSKAPRLRDSVPAH